MRIPLGNFGAPAPQQDQIPDAARFAPGGVDMVGRAVEGFGQALDNSTDTVVRANAQADAVAKQKADALARAKGANAQQSYEIAVKSAQMDVQDGLTHGTLAYQDAPQAFTDALGKIPLPQPDGLDPATAEQFKTGLMRTQASSAFAIRQSAAQAQDADFRSQWGVAQQQAGIASGMPGADGATLKQRLTSFVPLAQQAGLNAAQIQADLAGAKSTIDANTAKASIEQAGADLTALGSIKDGLTSDKSPWPDLTGAQRNALVTAVDAKMQTIADRNASAQERANAAGASALKQYTDFISKGGVPSPEYATQVATATEHTDSASGFNSANAMYKQVQAVLGMPVERQQNWMQQAQAALAKQGSDPATKAQLQNTLTAVNANIKAIHDDPLAWGPEHGYDAIKPLDMQQIATPDGIAAIGQQFQHRMDVIDAMRAHFGPTVPTKLLEPQEADALQAALQGTTYTNAAQLLGLVKKAVKDPQVYSAVMQQLTPKAPVLAWAGMLFDRDATLTTATHWFGPNETVSSQQAAETILAGQRILSGKMTGQTYALPKDDDFRKAFSAAVGDLFRGQGANAAEVAMQAVKAYYVGDAANSGDLSGDMNPKRLATAIKAAMGSPANVNGNGTVLPPWGMPADVFEQAAHNAFSREAKAAGLDAQVPANWSAVGLMDAGTGADGQERYYVTVPTPAGRRPLDTGKKDSMGAPIPFMLTLTPADTDVKAIEAGRQQRAKAAVDAARHNLSPMGYMP